MNRRKLRGTYQLVAWSRFWLNTPGRGDERTVVELVSSILNAGRRRGRTELAREIAERLGIVRDLDAELALPSPLRVTPLGHVGHDDAAPGLPCYASRELTARIDTSERRSPFARKRGRKP